MRSHRDQRRRRAAVPRRTPLRAHLTSRVGNRVNHPCDASAPAGSERSRHAPRRDGRRPTWATPACRFWERLGPFEWTLLAVLLVGITITGAMAIFNPSF